MEATTGIPALPESLEYLHVQWVSDNREKFFRFCNAIDAHAQRFPNLKLVGFYSQPQEGNGNGTRLWGTLNIKDGLVECEAVAST
jgi:hypothetical protein